MSQNAKLQEMVAHELSELMISPELVTEQELAELFEVRCGDKVFGHTSAKSLREFLIIHDDQTENLEVRKDSESEWCAFFEHPQIQRRKPQLVQNQSLEAVSEDQFWMLRDGQKVGPFTSEELKEKVEDCDLLATDLVSNDKGLNWMKLYEFEEFDRRNLQHHELPTTPNGKVFAESLRETRIQLARSDKEREEAEAIAGLAYIGNLRSGKGVEIERKKRRSEVNPEQEVISQDRMNKESESAPQQLVWYALFFLSLTGTLLIFLTWNNGAPESEIGTQSQQTTVVTQPGQVAPMLEPVSRTPAVAPTSADSTARQKEASSRRQMIEPSSAAAPRQQNSFRESPAFKRAQNAPRVSGERQMADDPYVDDYFYDDGSSTFESDPVRSQLSRETIEPTLDDTWVEEMTEPEMFEDQGIEEPPFQDLFEADPY